MRVYVSGAITGLPLDVARKVFADAAAGLERIGHDPVNPFDVPPHWKCDCPVPFEVAMGDVGAGGGHSWGCYLRGDLEALLDCDAILMLPGWQASHGARLELQVASAVGLTVLIGDSLDRATALEAAPPLPVAAAPEAQSLEPVEAQGQERSEEVEWAVRRDHEGNGTCWVSEPFYRREQAEAEIATMNGGGDPVYVVYRQIQAGPWQSTVAPDNGEATP